MKLKLIKTILSKYSNEQFFIHDKEPSLKDPISQMVTKKQCESKEFNYWLNELKPTVDRIWKTDNRRYNRKIWEWVYILQVLKKNNLLQNNVRGLGFGVGREPLVALMAKFGCNMLATDLPAEAAVSKGWGRSAQYSFNINELNEDGICDEATFIKRVTYRNVNMNYMDQDLCNYDFVYSSCALEHLGSLKKGIEFIENSLNCLNKGGIAIHTTEFNVSSNKETLKEGATVIYRKKDIVNLAKGLIKKGYKVTLNFSTGNDDVDKHYDVPPYFCNQYHLKLLLDKYTITSIGLIIRKI